MFIKFCDLTRNKSEVNKNSFPAETKNRIYLVIYKEQTMNGNKRDMMIQPIKKILKSRGASGFPTLPNND